MKGQVETCEPQAKGLSGIADSLSLSFLVYFAEIRIPAKANASINIQ